MSRPADVSIDKTQDEDGNQSTENPKFFDHKCMQQALKLYLDSTETQDGRLFSCAVTDYMAYLRTDPREQDNWEHTLELECAGEFLQLINNDKNWPVAQRLVPEFRQPQPDLEKVPYPLQYILRSVRSRLPDPPPGDFQRAMLAMDVENDAKRVEGHVNYVFFGMEEEREIAESRKKRAKETGEKAYEVFKFNREKDQDFGGWN